MSVAGLGRRSSATTPAIEYAFEFVSEDRRPPEIMTMGSSAMSRLARQRNAWLESLDARQRYPTWVLGAVLAGMFSAWFPFTILAVAIGPIAQELGAPETTLTWVVTAPMLLSAVAFPLIGKLGDLHGHRQVFLIGFLGATVVAAFTALAWDAYSLIAMRVVAGVLASATQPTAMALLFTVYGNRGRARAMGWWSMTVAAAPAVGLVAGGPLIDWFGWRIVFLIQAGLSTAALVLAAVVLRETRRRAVRFDIPGAAALAAGVCGLMAMLGGVRAFGIASAWVLAWGVVGALGLMAFVHVERRVAHPLLPLELFSSRNFSSILATSGFYGAAYMGAFILSPLILYEIFEFSVTGAALMLALRTVSISLFSLAGGALAELAGEREVAVIGCGVMTAALVIMAWSAWEISLIAFAISLVFQGVGDGLSQPPLASSIARAVDQPDLGIATGANRMVGQAGSSFGIALLTLVYGGVARPEVFALAFLLAAALAAAATVTARGITQ